MTDQNLREIVACVQQRLKTTEAICRFVLDQRSPDYCLDRYSAIIREQFELFDNLGDEIKMEVEDESVKNGMILGFGLLYDAAQKNSNHLEWLFNATSYIDENFNDEFIEHILEEDFVLLVEFPIWVEFVQLLEEATNNYFFSKGVIIAIEAVVKGYQWYSLNHYWPDQLDSSTSIT